MKWVYYIPTPPFKFDFMMFMSEIIRNIDLYRDQQQGYVHPLKNIMSKELRKEENEHGKNTPSIKDKGQNLNNMSSFMSLSSNEWAESIASGEEVLIKKFRSPWSCTQV